VWEQYIIAARIIIIEFEGKREGVPSNPASFLSTILKFEGILAGVPSNSAANCKYNVFHIFSEEPIILHCRSEQKPALLISLKIYAIIKKNINISFCNIFLSLSVYRTKAQTRRTRQ
jgi:hypothetical protein